MDQVEFAGPNERFAGVVPTLRFAGKGERVIVWIRHLELQDDDLLLMPRLARPGRGLGEDLAEPHVGREKDAVLDPVVGADLTAPVVEVGADVEVAAAGMELTGDVEILRLGQTLRHGIAPIEGTGIV